MIVRTVTSKSGQHRFDCYLGKVVNPDYEFRKSLLTVPVNLMHYRNNPVLFGNGRWRNYTFNVLQWRLDRVCLHDNDSTETKYPFAIFANGMS